MLIRDSSVVVYVDTKHTQFYVGVRNNIWLCYTCAAEHSCISICAYLHMCIVLFRWIKKLQ